MNLFGRGGKPNDFSNVTSPSPLDINNSKAKELIKSKRELK
jgi:hypothetical protein